MKSRLLSKYFPAPQPSTFPRRSISPASQGRHRRHSRRHRSTMHSVTQPAKDPWLKMTEQINRKSCLSERIGKGLGKEGGDSWEMLVNLPLRAFNNALENDSASTSDQITKTNQTKAKQTKVKLHHRHPRLGNFENSINMLFHQSVS
jgi:hypothetical protein